MPMKWNLIALAVAAGSTQLALASQQSEAQGLVEDSSLSVLSRAMYMNIDSRHGASNGASESANPAGYAEETGLGLHAIYESGFTQGTVGFGVDAFGLAGVKLDSGKGRAGALDMQPGSDGRAEDTFSRAGAAVKARISSTTLKYGEQFVDLPVLSTDDSRLLPESVEGFLATSGEIEGLELHAGHFTALTAQNGMGHDSYEDDFGKLQSLDLLGGSYAVSDELSVAYYFSDVEVGGSDVRGFKKHYANANYTLTLAEEQSLNFDFNIYKTRFDNRDASDDDNTIWSLAAAYTLGAHTFTLGHQRSSGDTGYYYGADGNGTVYLGNSVQFSDFVGEDERSWQARYDVDMARYGVPGLSFMTRYITGDRITTAAGEEGNEHEWNVETAYVIQDGVAKDLSFTVRHAVWRANSAYNADYDVDQNETRLIVEYPLSIL
ncbi:Porin D precursor [compost metagenome]